MSSYFRPQAPSWILVCWSITTVLSFFTQLPYQRHSVWRSDKRTDGRNWHISIACHTYEWNRTCDKNPCCKNCINVGHWSKYIETTNLPTSAETSACFDGSISESHCSSIPSIFSFISCWTDAILLTKFTTSSSEEELHDVMPSLVDRASASMTSRITITIIVLQEMFHIVTNLITPRALYSQIRQHQCKAALLFSASSYRR